MMVRMLSSRESSAKKIRKKKRRRRATITQAMEDCGVGRGFGQCQEVAHAQSLQQAIVVLKKSGAFFVVAAGFSLSCAFLCLVVVAVSSPLCGCLGCWAAVVLHTDFLSVLRF